MCITCELDITSSAYVTNYIVQMVPGSSCGEHTAGVFFRICICSGVYRMKFNRRQSMASAESELGTRSPSAFRDIALSQSE